MFKKIASVAVAALLVAGGATSAKAAGSSLNYSEFLASQGYLAMAAEVTANNAAVNASGHLQVSSTMTASVGGTTAAEVSQIAKTDGTSSSITTSVSSGGSVSGPYTVYIGPSGTYVPKTMALALPDLSNLDAAVARLGKSGSTYISVPAAVDSGLLAYTPTELFSGASTNTLSLLGDPTFNLGGTDLAGYSFTEPVATANADDSSATDYSYSVTMPASGVLPEMSWNVVTTFSASHVLVKNTLSLDMVLITETLVTTQTLDSSISITLPSATSSIAYSSLLTMGRKIQAENTLMPKATKIVAKAGKSVTAVKLVSAAKALKYAYTAVKNGIKLTVKYKNVPGSVCVTVVKGKAVKAHC